MTEYCTTCGQSLADCDCRTRFFSEEFGTSEIPPWEIRGIIIRPHNRTGSAEDAWPALRQASNINLCQAAADFYTLIAITSRIYDNRDNPMLPMIVGSAEQHLKRLVDGLDNVLVDYMWAVVGGELRHHKALCDKVLSVDKHEAWAGWRVIANHVGVDILIDAHYLFSEFDGSAEGDFGGRPWQEATALLYQRETGLLGPDEFSNRMIFVDRTLSLQHNTGAMLNKVSWLGSCKHLTDILETHGAPEPIITRLLRFASGGVRTLFNAYWAATCSTAHPATA